MSAPLVIGHRGFPARFPDNSLAGVEAALELGADGVEVDVRRCTDGIWVCHHNRSRRGVPIAGRSLAQLRRQGVPTLAEVVAHVPRERFLYVEVKPLAASSLAAGVASLVSLLAGRQVRLLSSSLAVLDRLALALRGVPRLWVVDKVPPRVPPGLELSPKHTLVEALLATGVPLHPWTVDRPARVRALASLSVASITSNRPDLALEALRG